MKVLITGTTQGIGKAIAELFLEKGHEVIGIDRQDTSIEHASYTHITEDIRNYDRLPEIDGVEVLINNAGTQNEDDITTNLRSLIKVTEKYGVGSLADAISCSVWPPAIIPGNKADPVR